MADDDDATTPPVPANPARPTGPAGIDSISIIEEMQRSYLDYAMSVIVSRALPDVRDGLKPVHRRILYAMHGMGLFHNRSYRKSAGVVGEVMGKFHPHGDSSIYDALVRMAQDWSMRAPLIDGQGNFGSIDGDSPAAMRYTECKLEKVADSLLEDIDKETVDFQDNYDGREREPVVLPARVPNLLVNGSGGIAVGMATNIPPHNLGEIVDGTIAMIDNPAISLDELMEIIPGPDFPTGAIVLGRAGIRLAYETGRGSILMRGKVHTEPMRNDREQIVITEVPFQVNKATMIEKMADLVREKRIEGISDLRDESDREGYRVVIELKRDASADVILNQLYRFTPLQTSFGANMVALNGGKPEQMALIDILSAFIAFREEVINRRTKFLLRKARERAHVLVGLAIAVANIDEVIKLIRAAPDPATAREQLMTREWEAKDVAPLVRLIDDPRHRISEAGTYRLSEAQARAILDLRLQRLTALGRDEIGDELSKLGDEIKDYLEILSSRSRVREIIKAELIAVRDEFATPRRTELTDGAADMDDEDLIPREDMVVTVSHGGYIKRVPLATYRSQRRGGKGRSGMSLKNDEDSVTRLFVANTHTPVLFFSSRGIVYKEKVWRLPLATPQSRGKALINLLPLEKGERITSSDPDYDPLFAYGYGLTYAKPGKVGTLSEDKSLEGVSKVDLTKLMVAGVAQAPWRMVVSDASGNGELPTSAGSSPGGGVTVTATDDRAQEDMRLVRFARGGRFAFVTEPVDLEREANGDMAVRFAYRVDGATGQRLAIGGQCGGTADCGGLIDLTAGFKAALGKGWRTATVKLSCLADQGVYMGRLTSPFALESSGGFTVGLREVALVQNDGSASCGL